jgi:hypothetical protein
MYCYAEFHYAECHYVECYYAEFHYEKQIDGKTKRWKDRNIKVLENAKKTER